jgi:phenylalanyl-tRNA synthetase beta chain
LQNPLNVEQSVMRTCLCPGLLEAVSRARRHGERNVRLFATGAIFLKGQEERPSFAAVIAGDRDVWLSKSQSVDVWDAKGLAESFIVRMTGHTPTIKPENADHLHPRGSSAIYVQNARVGMFGPLHPEVMDAMDTGADVQLVEIDLHALAEIGPRPFVFASIPKFPSATRDIALVVKEEVRAGDVEAAVREAAGPLAESVAIFDRFTGGSLPAGHVSLALRVVYRSAERTLTDQEVDASHGQIVERVSRKFGATLRTN